MILELRHGDDGGLDNFESVLNPRVLMVVKFLHRLLQSVSKRLIEIATIESRRLGWVRLCVMVCCENQMWRCLKMFACFLFFRIFPPAMFFAAQIKT